MLHTNSIYFNSGLFYNPGYTEWSEKRQQLSYNNPFNTHLSINCTGGQETRWYKQIGEIEDCLTDGLLYIRYNKKF